MTHDTIKQFYEDYWQQDEAPPQGDPTTVERMTLLQAILLSLRGNSRNGCFQVLDAGCGDGTFLAFMHELGFQVAGADLSARALTRARKKCPGADLRMASLESSLPFADATFDAVWCTEVLEHLFDVHKALAELNRVLKTDGTLLVTTPYHGLMKNLLITLGGFDQHFNPILSHIRFFTRTTLTQCLRRTGFVPISWSGMGRMWPLYKSVFVVARKHEPAGLPPEIIG